MLCSAAILQIAFRNVVFVVDLDVIDDTTYCLTAMLNRLFSDPKILKLGEYERA